MRVGVFPSNTTVIACGAAFGFGTGFLLCVRLHDDSLTSFGFLICGSLCIAPWAVRVVLCFLVFGFNLFSVRPARRRMWPVSATAIYRVLPSRGSPVPRAPEPAPVVIDTGILQVRRSQVLAIKAGRRGQQRKCKVKRTTLTPSSSRTPEASTGGVRPPRMTLLVSVCFRDSQGGGTT